MKIVATLMLLFVVSPALGQEIYKWKDAKGQWHFSQTFGGQRAILWITVDRISYQHGFAKIEGTAMNQSPFPVKSRRIIAKATDALDGTLYVEFFGWPADSAEAGIEPQQSAAFTVLLQMPEKSRGREVRFELSADGYSSDVNWQTNQQMRIW